MEVYRVEKGNSPEWLYKAYDYVRTDAFVFGQNIPIEMEFGHDDPIDELEAIVLVEDNKPIAGCRITYPEGNIAKIGRVCVIREKQKNGVGHVLIAETEKWIRERGFKHIVINSQDRAVAFYKRCGYELVSGINSEIYENNSSCLQSGEENNRHKKDFGFSCVLVEKYLD